MTPKDALRQMVKAYPGSYDSIAPRLGKTAETLRKELSDDATADGGAVVELPVREMSSPCVSAAAGEVVQELSHVTQAALTAIADGSMSANELASIEREVSEALGALQNIQRADRAMHAKVAR